jgi:peptidoglycan/LPS O-acetylase OafA/YrhL
LSAALVQTPPADATPAETIDARPRFEALDSLRGVAALGVAYGHFYGPQIFDKTHNFAFYLLVDLFFILSGFVLAHRYLDDWMARRVSLAQFAVHRFARLYPLHLYGLFGMLAFSLVRSALYAPPELSWFGALKSGIDLYPDGRAYTFALHLLLAQNLGFTPSGLSWHGPSWSISVEFYCLLLLFFWIGLWRNNENVSFVTPTVVLALVCVLAIFNGAHSLDVHYQNLSVWANYGVLRCLSEAAIGLLVYRLYRAYGANIMPGRTGATIVEIVLLILIGTLLFRRPFTSPADVLIIPLFAALVFWLAPARGWVARGLLLPPLRWAGRLSYSIYINHFLLVMSLSLVTFKPWWLYFGLVLALSWATYHGIEAPARRAINRRLGPHV